MEDVANRAQVAASTVSLYLRQPDLVSQKLAPAIETAIKELGYVPNRLAGALAAANTRAIAVIIPSLTNAFFSSTVTAIQTVLEEHNYQLLLGTSEYSQDKEAKLVQTFLSWSPAALVLTGLQHHKATRALLRTAALPIAEMWEIGGKPFDLQVGFSHELAGQRVTEHLHAVGCRKIAYIGARMTSDHRAAQRALGYKSWIEANTTSQPLIIDTLEIASPQGAGEAMAQLLSQHPDIDGVCCSNDVLALGVLFEAQRRGIRIPDDIAVTGFGDLPFSSASVPTITTIRPPSKIIGLKVANEILQLVEMKGHKDKPTIIDVGFELVIRGSSKLILSH